MSQLLDFSKRIQEIKDHYLLKQGELDMLNKRISNKEEEKTALEENNKTLLLKKMLIEESASEARENGRELLSQISTSFVQSIFSDDTSVELKISSKDTIPTAEAIVLNKCSNDIVEVDPKDSDGGGLADVVSLALFMAVGQTVNDNYAPYILDEPSKYLSKGEFSEKFADAFKELVEYTGRQVIVSTHDECLLESGDTKYQIIKDWDNGISNIERE